MLFLAGFYLCAVNQPAFDYNHRRMFWASPNYFNLRLSSYGSILSTDHIFNLVFGKAVLIKLDDWY